MAAQILNLTITADEILKVHGRVAAIETHERERIADAVERYAYRHILFTDDSAIDEVVRFIRDGAQEG